MINMLVIEDNVIQCQQFINYISSMMPNVKVYSMLFNGLDALEIIKKQHIDIILLDLVLPDISGLEIIKYIEYNNFLLYKNSIVIVSGEANKHPELYRNEYVYECFQKPVDLEKIVETLKNIIDNENEEKEKAIIKSKIYNELQNLNYNFSYIGTQYLIECIFILYNYNNPSINLSKDVYPRIAKKYLTSTNTIKVDIFQAILNSYYDCEQSKLEKYFNRYFYSKPKTKDIIYKVLEKIKDK